MTILFSAQREFTQIYWLSCRSITVSEYSFNAGSCVSGPVIFKLNIFKLKLNTSFFDNFLTEWFCFLFLSASLHRHVCVVS